MKIGRINIELPVLLAPMAGYTDYPFRLLCKKMGADVIGVVFIIELEGLGARELLGDIPIHSLLKYPA